MTTFWYMIQHQHTFRSEKRLLVPRQQLTLNHTKDIHLYFYIGVQQTTDIIKSKSSK